MLRKQEFKKRGRNAFYHNWKSCIIVCFLYLVLVGGSVVIINREFDYDYRDNIKNLNINDIKGDSNSDIVNEFINGLSGNKPKEYNFLNNTTRGVIGTLVNSVSKTGSFLFGALNAINEALFKDRIGPSVVIIIGASLSLLYWIFISKVLEVGLARFFLENHAFTKTKVNRLLMPYKLNKTTNIAYTMFLKNIYSILWSLTIIGGPIKFYSYKLVPFILAENPNMKPKDVIKLSRDMMNGYKWEMFKLDLSFIGYYLLGFLTFNISNIVFTTPFKNATYAEIYIYMRDLAKTKGIDNSNMLKDNLLDSPLTIGEYPLYDSLIKLSKTHFWLNFNYERDYSLIYLLLICIIASIIGFLWETLFHLFQYGVLVKRGTLHGPWLPIYGGGCLALLVLLKKYRKNPFTYFILSIIICGIIEYTTSIYLELVHHLSWWNYNGYFLNLNGRVCLEGLILFGIGGVLATYILAPIISNFIDRLKPFTRNIICIILTSLLVFDFILSLKNPNTGKGVTSNIEYKEVT